MEICKRKENESTYQFIKRMVMAKIDGTFYGNYSDWIKDVFGKEHSDDVARREFYGVKMLVMSIDDDKELDENTISLDELMDRKIAIDKERIKLSDERAHLNRIKRDMARGETIRDYAIEASNIVAKEHPINMVDNDAHGVNSGILMISDWHYGIDIDNSLNKYNPDIAKERVAKLIHDTIKDIKLFDIKEVYVCCLGDMISGLIHSTIRLENRIDVITQVIEVSQLIANLLDEIGKYAKVKFFNVSGNHDRVVADLKESLSKENFSRMIYEYLDNMFKMSPNVMICKNDSGDDISTFHINGWDYCVCHGDKGKFKNILSEMSTMLHNNYDAVLVGHLHHLQLEEQNESMVITNGCLCGTDEYAKNLRKTSHPSQNFIVVSENSCCEYLHPIKLD